jgi:orotate phosphoribosyltransferase
MNPLKTHTARDIAKLALEIGAITLKVPPNSYQWASGWRTPMYNDNRKHLGFHKNRSVILHGLGEITRNIEKVSGFEFDYILGTSTSAIAWGALLAKDLELPFIILHENQPYEFVNLGLIGQDIVTDIPLLTNAPWGIPESVIKAHSGQRPFLYERKEKKKHGMENKIEGNIVKNSEIDAVIVTPVDPESDMKEEEEDPVFFDVTTLIELGLKTRSVKTKGTVVKKAELKDKRVLIIEDLISTGGSSLKEAVTCRELGAIVTNVIAIYNYEFPIATQKAKDANVTIHNLLTYEKLLEVAIKKNYISEDKLEILREWREDPEAWSDKYCGTNFTNNGYEKLAGV